VVTSIRTRAEGVTRRSALRLWAPAVLWAALIFTLSSISRPPAPPGGLTDKHEHMAAYAVMAALVLRALSGAAWRGVTARTAAAAAIIATLYGASDEIHQSFVPLRNASWLDLVADAGGAFTAAALLGAWAIIRRRR
jgi:VanZ family protein